eukprot:CAMPEP_0172165002 /NCGR_PEP_ID=MMETSP1050-20130122/8168_1 /TAXON_ID=233186 /ORGANISM="Cryptomonas curvata, Strain CCAP979/52" /LENGTH=81 /DNA_ID=CAMNT_0012835421 /DNA_START=210 /DNA_END=452 /DNA_ORIENTATION=+
MSFIVEKSSALPTLAEVVEKSGHSLKPDHGCQWVAESVCESPEQRKEPSPSSSASMSSDEPSQACTTQPNALEPTKPNGRE